MLLHGFKTFVLSSFEWPLKTGFTVSSLYGRDYPTKFKVSNLVCVF